MRILNWDNLKREQKAWAAFNTAFLKAIDPRLITHRPRDPDKKRLMMELGIESVILDVEQKCYEEDSRASCRKGQAKGKI